MTRIPELDTETMSEPQRRVFDAIVAGPRGVVRGPVQVWLHNPGLAEHAQALGAYCRFGTVLPARLSELAIIVTAAHWRAGYEWRSHAPMAIEGGLPASVVEAVRVGAAPDFARDDEAAVYHFATELLRTQAVSPQTWEVAAKLLGSHGVVDLVGILGYYALISMTIKAFEIGGPAGGGDVFG